MSNFESTALSTDTTSLPSSATPATSAATPTSESGATSSSQPVAAAAAADGTTPLTAEETAEVFSEQPTGDGPTAEEMEDRKDATSSADNLLPTDKLQNGLKNVSPVFRVVCVSWSFVDPIRRPALAALTPLVAAVAWTRL